MRLVKRQGPGRLSRTTQNTLLSLYFIWALGSLKQENGLTRLSVINTIIDTAWIMRGNWVGGNGRKRQRYLYLLCWQAPPARWQCDSGRNTYRDFLWLIRAKLTEGSSVVLFIAMKGLQMQLELCFTLLKKLHMAVALWPEMYIQCSGPNIRTSPLEMIAWVRSAFSL